MNELLTLFRKSSYRLNFAILCLFLISEITFLNNTSYSENNNIPFSPNAVNTSIVNGNWGAGTTWSLGHVPLVTEDVSIATIVVFNTAASTVASLTIGTGDSLTLNRGTSLTVNGVFTNSGVLTYAAGGGTQSLILKGDFTNAGTFNEITVRDRLFFSGTSLQTISNTGTISSPMTDFTVNNTVGINISSSTQLVVLTLNLYTGTVVNSSKITVGNGGATAPVIQRGTVGNISPAGSMDVSSVFNIGTGGLDLIYDDSTTPITMGNEVPPTLSFDRLDCFDGTIVNLNSSITITNNFVFNSNFSGSFNIGANTLTLGKTMTLTAGYTGLLKGGATSNLVMTGTTATSIAGVTNGLNNFINNNNKTVTLTGAITVFDTLGLGVSSSTKDSTFLTLGNGAIITRSGGTLTAVPTFGTSVNIIYTGTSTYSTDVEMPSANGILNNLTVNTPDTIKQANSANTVTVNGTFSLVSGMYSIGSNTLTLKGAVSGTTGLNGGPNSILTLGGTGSVTLPNITNNLKTFKINRNAANIITLGGNLIVNNTLNMSGGKINTGAFILTLGSAADTASVGTLTYTSGQIITGSTGGFKRWFSANTIFNALFPIGTTTNLNLITFSYTAAPTTGGSLTAKFDPTDPGTNSLNPIDDNGYTVDTYSPSGYWQLTIGDGMSNDGTYSLGLEGQGFNVGGTSILNYQLLRILKRPAPGNDWTASGTYIAGTGTNNDPTAWRSALVGFSQFAFGGNSVDNPFGGPLPVELSSFSSSSNGRNVNLSWSTSNEQNNSGFQIERLNNNDKTNQWFVLSFVKGKNNNNSLNSYSYSDNNLQSGKYSYRLKQVDYNGAYKYYSLNNIIEIGLPAKLNLSQNYPNPFNPTTKIDYSLPFDSKVTLLLYDILGREVKKVINEQQTAGFYTVEINTNNLASGIYIYKLAVNSNGANSILIKKMSLIK
jgi:hypothetical protein